MTQAFDAARCPKAKKRANVSFFRNSSRFATLAASTSSDAVFHDAIWMHTGLGQMQLERTQLFRSRAVWGTAEESREPLDGADVLALRIGHEPAHAHVFEHALAQRADGLLAHWGLLS